MIAVIIATFFSTKIQRMSSQKRYCCAIPRSQRGIVSALNEKGIDMAIASCSSADNTIKSLLEKFGLQSMFVTKVNLFSKGPSSLNYVFSSCERYVNGIFYSTCQILFWFLGLKTYMQEVFTSSCHKKEHFQKIRQGTGVAYQFMLFFDEGPANIDTVTFPSSKMRCAHLCIV